MAFDKVVDSTALEAGLTQIATAIREKGGTTDVLAFPDAMAEAIAAIETGGGGGGNFACGTFTPADTTAAQIEITHGLGAVPELFFIAAASSANGLYSRQKPYGQAFFYYVKIGVITSGISMGKIDCGVRCRMSYADYEGYNSGTVKETLGTGFNYYIAADSEKIYWPNRNTNYGFGKTPVPFVWVAMKEIPS